MLQIIICHMNGKVNEKKNNGTKMKLQRTLKSESIERDNDKHPRLQMKSLFWCSLSKINHYRFCHFCLFITELSPSDLLNLISPRLTDLGDE